jgi:hypothetical protein
MVTYKCIIKMCLHFCLQTCCWYSYH